MWDLVEGDIKQGAEVNVDGDLSFEFPNPKSFWGAVVSDSSVDNGFYAVEDNEVVLHQCCRERLRLRVKFSIAVGGVYNDNTHDRHYQNNFTERVIRWLEYYLVRKRPEDLGKGKVKFPRINHPFIHMKNVFQHFKSTGAIVFLTCS